MPIFPFDTTLYWIIDNVLKAFKLNLRNEPMFWFFWIKQLDCLSWLFECKASSLLVKSLALFYSIRPARSILDQGAWLSVADKNLQKSSHCSNYACLVSINSVYKLLQTLVWFVHTYIFRAFCAGAVRFVKEIQSDQSSYDMQPKFSGVIKQWMCIFFFTFNLSKSNCTILHTLLTLKAQIKPGF